MDRVLDRLDDLYHEVTVVREGVAELRGWKEKTEANVERFWSQEWPLLQESLRDHEIRLRRVEDAVTALQMLPEVIRRLDAKVDEVKAQHEERIRILEDWKVKVVSAVAAAGAIGGALGAFLEQGIKTLGG